MTTDAGTVPLKLVLLDEDTPDELYCRYQGQFDAQPCLISLDLRDGTFTAEYNGNIGGVPAAWYNGIVRVYPLPKLTTAKANEILRELAEDAQKVLGGGAVEWDGNNMVGLLLTAGAQAAEGRISGRLENLSEYPDSFDLVGEMDAGEYWSEGDLPEGLSATTTDAELEDMAGAAEKEAVNLPPFGHTILTGATEYLTDRREEMREVQRERLVKVAEELDSLRNMRNVEAKRQELTAERNALIVAISAYGDSARQLGALADLSHVQILNILQAATS